MRVLADRQTNRTDFILLITYAGGNEISPIDRSGKKSKNHLKTSDRLSKTMRQIQFIRVYKGYTLNMALYDSILVMILF